MTEELAPGIKKEMALDGKVVIYIIESVAQSSIDIWQGQLMDILTKWPSDVPYLVIYDVTHPDVTLTPYMRKQATEVSNLRPDVTGRVALILRPNPFTYMFRFFLKTLRNKSRQSAIFFDREVALKWVALELDKV